MYMLDSGQPLLKKKKGKPSVYSIDSGSNVYVTMGGLPKRLGITRCKQRPIIHHLLTVADEF